MEESLFFVSSNVVNVEDVSDFTFTSPNSAIISDSCEYVGTQIRILVEFGFHVFLSRTLSPLLYVFFFIAISPLIFLIN